ncbi:MAG TPA: hypothetical protein VK324_06580, partial [Tepidisphaeraceae bacterium]|nr:hypothetical protein [Tepidisphaeraceae bacterium]
MPNLNDPLKEKFRTTDAVDQEVDAALAGVDVDSLMAVDKAAPGGGDAPAGPTRPGEKQVRVGTISAVTKEWVLVDLGGKSQGVCPTLQFEDVEPVAGA